MGFDENKVVWSADEFAAGAAGDRLVEKVDKYLTEHSTLSRTEILGLAAMLVADDRTRLDAAAVLKFLFSRGGLKGFLDAAKDLICMLERDNDWFN